MSSIASLAVCCAACCHINRLPKYGSAIDTIEFAIGILENPTLRFTRFESLDSGILINPGPRQGHSETRFGDVLTSFGRDELASCLVDHIPASFSRLLHWRAAGKNLAADAQLKLEVQEYSLTASEAQAAVGLEWMIKGTLLDRVTGEIIWQDCIEKTIALPGISVLELSRMTSARRRDIVCQAAEDLTNFLAKAIAREGPLDRG
jgi:hypothetical protein